jgi:hypothetical protein
VNLFTEVVRTAFRIYGGYGYSKTIISRGLLEEYRL